MSLLQSTKLQDEIEFLTSAVRVSPFSKHVLVYYVPGNPGYTEYYRNFLRYLTQNLSRNDGSTSHSHQTQYHIYGESLAGFQLEGNHRHIPYSLDEIKWSLIERIEHKAAEIIETHGLKQDALPVILMGHSIGAWLVLETIENSRNPSKLAVQRRSRLQSAQLVAGILLFPTVTELAKSPNGLRFGWALQYQLTILVLSMIVRILFALVPLFVLAAVLQLILRMPYHGALVTASFLKKKGAVSQALHMAHDELEQVREDEWSDGLWGVQSSSIIAKEAKAIAKDSVDSPAKLFFYWGSDDHWVANTTRDSMLAKRAQTAAANDKNKPIMHVDTNALPHAFSLRDDNALIVANKVAIWIEEI